MVDEREEVFELCNLETDDEITKFASDINATLLAIISPHIPYKTSPARAIIPELNVPEKAL